MVGLVVLLGDYSVRGNDSLIYKALLSKVFSSQGDFSLSASTGVYRYEMIAMAILAMAMNPFGMGYEAWVKLYRLNSFADAGWISIYYWSGNWYCTTSCIIVVDI